MVQLRSLRLADFRNYEALKLPIAARFVVLTGDNGAGKTNLLEAVSMLAPGRGLRRATYSQMARISGSGGFSVGCTLGRPAEDVSLLTLVRPPSAGAVSQRLLRIDDSPAAATDELLDLCRILWLTPSMDGLFTGPAGDRRRFLDRLVLTLDPGHGRRSTDYERAMRGRNRLLAEDRRDDLWLSGLEEQMAALGLAVHLARSETVHRLRHSIAAHAVHGAAFPAAELDLESGFSPVDFGRPAVDLEDEIAARLRRGRGLDRAAGRTLEGPHRAELSVLHQEKAMPAALASTGEQKALLIGLVLAHAELVRSQAGMAPILLLDEVAAHLDPGRRTALFERVAALGGQSFMTGTDASLFDALSHDVQMLRVQNGALS